MKQISLNLLHCLLLTLIPLSVFAQHDPVIDSLETLIRTHPDDTLKADWYCSVSYRWRNEDLAKSLNYSQKAIELSTKLDFIKGQKCAYNNAGQTLYGLSRFPESINAFEGYRHVCVRSGDSVGLAWAYNNIGNVYIEMASYGITSRYYDSALWVRQLLKDTIGIANSYVNIGYFYKDQGNYLYALDALYKAAATLEKTNRYMNIANCYTIIGSVYLNMKKYALANSFYDKAYVIYERLNSRANMAVCLHSKGELYFQLNDPRSVGLLKQALDIYESLGDKRQMVLCYVFSGNVFFSKKEYAKALENYYRALALSEEIGGKRSDPAIYNNIAEALLKTGRYDEANKYGHKALEAGEQTNRKDHQLKSYGLLSEISSAMGNFEQALKYHKMQSAIQDSIVNESSARSMVEMQTRYETGIKDLEISKQAVEISRKQTQLILAIISICAVIILSFLLYNRYRLRQKSLMDAEIIHQQELRNHAIIEAEEKERIRIARDLHDGVGQQLSAVKMNLSAFENELSLKSIPQQDKMKALLSLVDEAVKEVRAVSHNLMPNALLRSGLSTAVREFVNKISVTDALKVDLQIVGINDRLESTTETVLYRVLQECVSNIVKHANADRISIQLVRHDSRLNMMIEDNGKGFDAAKANDFEGIGLKNIVSRVQYLNGTVDFDSTPGRGTTVIVDVPV